MSEHPPDRPDDLARDLPELEEDPELRATLGLVDSVRPSAPVGQEETDVDWSRLAHRLSLEAPGAAPLPEETPGAGGSRGTADPTRSLDAGGVGGLRRSLWLAASVVGLLLLGGAFWATVPVRRAAPPGTTLAVTLPAGTEVVLNAGSVLRHPRGFSWIPGLARAQRRVDLQGEAFFQVAEDGRPFEVRTFNAEVRVLGTRFGVRAREEVEGETAVVVEEGRVRLGARGVSTPSSAVVLEAGERSRIGVESPAPEPPAAVEVGAIAPWRSGGLTLVDRSLPAIFQELERVYGTSIRMGSGARESEGRVSLYYPGPVALERVLEDVTTARGLRYREVAGGWEVF